MQRAVSTLFNIMLRLAPFFFIFSAGTNAHYVNSAVMTGQAKYQATGRGFVIAHVSFSFYFYTWKLFFGYRAKRTRSAGTQKNSLGFGAQLCFRPPPN